MATFRSLVLGLLGALGAWMAAAPVLACGGSSKPGASEPGGGDSRDGDARDGELQDEPDADCCCQRYDDDGNPTGAAISDRTRCKSTGGTCTDDPIQCQSE